MSKARDIRVEAKVRIQAAGFAKTVIRGHRDFNPAELPGVCVYISDRTVSAAAPGGNRYRMDAQLTVEYHRSAPASTVDSDAYADAVDDQADSMLGQIRVAMEVDPRQFGADVQSRILLHPGLSFESDEIEYPESGGETIAVRVVYAVPHIEEHG